VLGGINNVNSGIDAVVGGIDGLNLTNYGQTYGIDSLTATGDSNYCRLYWRDDYASSSLVNIRGSADNNLIFRDVQFNLGAAVGIHMSGKLVVMGVSISGVTEGDFCRYEMDMALTTTGTQGATSGWTAKWQDGSTSANSPAMTRTDTGGGLTITTAPVLDCNASGVMRIPVQAGVTDTIHWLGYFEGLYTIWAT
jgi:hypothetical protein